MGPGRATPNDGLLGCFHGLMEKARTIKTPGASSQAEAVEDSQDFKAKVIKESLSLDSGRGSDGPPLSLSRAGSAPSQPGREALEDQPPSGQKEEDSGMDRCKVRFLRDSEAFEWLIQSLEMTGRGSRVLLRAYSFDQPDVIHSLKGSSERGCLTMVVTDRSQAAGKTKAQLQVLKELRASGVRVRLADGLNVNQAYESDRRSVRVGRKLRGLQHGKSAFVQPSQENKQTPVKLIVGSCNFTTSSKANHEAGVALELLEGSATAQSWLKAFEEIFDQAASMEDFERDLDGSTGRRVGARKPTVEEQ